MADNTNPPSNDPNDFIVDLDVELKGDHTIRPKRAGLPTGWPRPNLQPPAPAAAPAARFEAMTEAEWNAGRDPAPMLAFLRGKVSERKLRLFGVACCWRIWHHPTLEMSVAPGSEEARWAADVRSAVSIGERLADGRVTPDELEAATLRGCSGSRMAEAFLGCCASGEELYDVAENVLAEVVKFAWYEAKQDGSTPDERRVKDECQAQVALLLCLFGGLPFGPVALDSTWLTSTAKKLAESIYDEHAFDRLPILADALEEAGCTDAAILEHCRGPGPHVRGCWVVDLITGRA